MKSSLGKNLSKSPQQESLIGYVFSIPYKYIDCCKRENVHNRFTCKPGDKTIYCKTHFKTTLCMWVCPVKMGNILTEMWPVVISGLCCDKCFVAVGFFPSVLLCFPQGGGLGCHDYLRLESEITERAETSDPVLFLALVSVLCCQAQQLFPLFRYYMVPNSCFSKLVPYRCEIPKEWKFSALSSGWKVKWDQQDVGAPQRAQGMGVDCLVWKAGLATYLWGRGAPISQSELEPELVSYTSVLELHKLK